MQYFTRVLPLVMERIRKELGRIRKPGHWELESVRSAYFEDESLSYMKTNSSNFVAIYNILDL